MKNKIAYTIIRILLGLVFLMSGAVKFFPSQPAGMPQPALDFMMAMGATGYFIPFLGLAEILIGVLLLFNLAVPLAMMILSPIMIQIILFNIFLGPSIPGLLITAVLAIFQVYIMYCTWSAYKPLFQKIKIGK